jgi:hypothetical protein
MASYRGHLAFSTALGVAYGAGAIWGLHLDWPTAVFGAGLTAVSGWLPDLDSDSGVPVRALFGLFSVLVPLLLLPRLLMLNLSLEMVILVLLGCHLLIRYGLAAVFKRLTVHRGMFHSIPAMLVSGLIVFLIYHHTQTIVRFYLAGGAMLGFLSHLVLDELCSVNLGAGSIRLNKFAGSALKLTSPSWTATLATYTLLAGLIYLAALQFPGPRATLLQLQQQALHIADSSRN